MEKEKTKWLSKHGIHGNRVIRNIAHEGVLPKFKALESELSDSCRV